jgi:hypothetical protein
MQRSSSLLHHPDIPVCNMDDDVEQPNNYKYTQFDTSTTYKTIKSDELDVIAWTLLFTVLFFFSLGFFSGSMFAYNKSFRDI